MRSINATLRLKCIANPRLEMLAVLEAFSKFVVNNVTGDNTVSKVLDRVRMYLVAVAFHKGIEASSSKSFVNYNGHKMHSHTV